MGTNIDLKMVRVFDGHLHIIDKRFPLEANQGFLPEEFTTQDYLARTGSFQLAGGVVVSGSFQGFDQSYLVAALQRLGPAFVGVTQLPAGAADADIIRLNAAGVRGVRFNLYRGGSETIHNLEELALRVHDLAGWHTELYVDSSALGDLKDRLLNLPALSIDHLGLSKAGFKDLLQLVERGVKVKATGFGRLDFAVGPALREICQINPEALIFGTDLPSTRAPKPYSDDDIHLICDVLGDHAGKVLHDNGIAFYRPRAVD